jgi:aldose 1-epimerase
MNTSFVLMETGAMRCELRPDLGGCISGLWFQDVAVLRSSEDYYITNVRQSANFPLVPFSNRLANACLTWGGESFELPENFAPEPHSIHGLGWQRPWQVLQNNATSSRITLSHRPDAHCDRKWPFAFDCEQSFNLSQDSLHVEMQFTNTDERTAPVGLGWHPYVVKRPGAYVNFKADGMWETDTHKLPSTRVPCTGLKVACDDLEINHVFDGVDHGVTLFDSALEVRITSNLPRLLVSTEPAKNFIALEPVSHVPDAFNRLNHALLGTVALRKGQSWNAWMTIKVHQASGQPNV